MKKIIFVVLILALVFLSLPLASQYRYTFPEYMENLQSKVPLKAIEWFEENAYSPTYGVTPCFHCNNTKRTYICIL